MIVQKKSLSIKVAAHLIAETSKSINVRQFRILITRKSAMRETSKYCRRLRASNQSSPGYCSQPQFAKLTRNIFCKLFFLVSYYQINHCYINVDNSILEFFFIPG